MCIRDSSIAHAFGAVFDNPDLICAVTVGDGEAETGPLATSWQSNKFLLSLIHIYVAEEPVLQELPAMVEVSEHLFGGMPVQLGWCNGPNTKHPQVNNVDNADLQFGHSVAQDGDSSQSFQGRGIAAASHDDIRCV